VGPAAAVEAVRMAFWLVLLGCGSVPEPTTVAGCAAIGDATARENCRFGFLRPLFESGDIAAFEAALGGIEDPLARDLVRLRLAIDDPSRADRLCGRVETASGRGKCQQVLGRPHLRAPR